MVQSSDLTSCDMVSDASAGTCLTESNRAKGLPNFIVSALAVWCWFGLEPERHMDLGGVGEEQR